MIGQPAALDSPGDTVRWRLDLRYDGTAFSGWARQPGLRTVQGELELWLSRLIPGVGQPQLVCAGRTDAGVHARGQVAHLDLPAEAIDDAHRLRRRLRRALPADLVVTGIAVAPAGFDARFSASWRRYCYRLADPETIPDPLLRGFVSTVNRPIAVAELNRAGQLLLGLRDFGAFCKRREGATTIRTLLELGAVRSPAGLVEVTVRADAFCHSMVRCLVGGLVEVGAGRRDQSWLVTRTAAAVRSGEIPVLPARGLTLEEVGYPDPADLAARVAESRTLRTLPQSESCPQRPSESGSRRDQ